MADGAGKEVGRISIKVTPNLKGFYRELKTELEKIERSLSAKIQVEPDMGNFRSEVAAKTKGMRTKVKVDADVDRSFIGRITQTLSNIKGPSFGSGINPAGYAALFAGIAVVAAPLIGLLTSALLTLPGLIASVAVPIGALVVGIDGIKAAAKGLGESFAQLKKDMTAPVEAQFKPVFDSLAKVLPALKAPLLAVTQGLADMANGFVTAVTSGPGLEKLQGTIRNIGAAFSKMAPGISSFTDGLLTLAEKFTSKLPDFADWFNKTGDDFRKWVDKLKLDTVFEGLGSTLKTLLEGAGRILSEGLKFMEDPKKIEGFNNGLKSIADTLQSIVNLSNQINESKLFPDKDTPNPLTGQGIKDDLTKPFTSPDAPWRGYMESLSQAWDGIQIKAQQVWAQIPMFASTAFTTIQTLFTTFSTSLSTVWTGITTAATAAFTGVQSAVSAAWHSVVSAVTSGAQQVVSAISGAWSALPGLAAAAFGALVSTVTSVMSQALSAVVAGAGQIVAEIAALGGKIAAAAGNMGGALVGAGRALMDGLLSGIKAGLQAVLSFASGIAAKIAAVKGPLPKDRKELIPAGNALMEGLGTGLEQGLDPVLDRAKSIAKQIFEAFKETFGTAPQGLTLNLGNLQSGLQAVTDTSKDFSKALAPTADLAKGSSLVGPETKAEVADLKQQLADLELQRKRLAVQKDQAGTKDEKAGIQAQIDKINEQKRLLDLRKAELGTLQDQTGELGKQKTLGQTIAEMIDQGWSSGVDAIAGFGRANLDQAMSDLGIGGGALTAALDQGLDYGQQLAGNVFNFQVSSVDDAIAVKNNQLNKAALQYNRA
ncbi:hypothetical protein [Mycolicibacterium houstonense]|uniref:hypothetical protein n=1 Tax=Mycolicibacterium houstonense TaxID=146021 RepID=UPI0008331E75|nr:hypothetical protein [Mycolicibacterium houstonense]